MSHRLSKDILLQRIHSVADGRYEVLNESEIENTTGFVKCQCLVCNHKFESRYENLTRLRTGCPRCRGVYHLQYDEMIQQLDIVSKGRYKYQLVDNYTTKKNTKIKCVCSLCAYTWTTTLSSLLSTRETGCTKCNRGIKYTQDEAINKLNEVSKGRYKFYIIGQYTNAKSKVRCECLKCGYKWVSRFSSLYYRHTGCVMCHRQHISNKKTLSSEQINRVLEYVSKGRYRYNLQGYKNTYSKVECVCLKCGRVWRCTYNNLVFKKRGCPNYCFKEQVTVSTHEHEITDFIKQNFPQLEIQQSIRSLIKNPQGTHAMELDIYIPELKLAIEYNGTYWHSDESIVKRCKGKFTSAQQYHDYKTEQCKQKGIRLIHIAEQDYKNNKQEVLDLIIKGVENARGF